MAGALFVMPYPELVDIDGVPLAGGSVSFEQDAAAARVYADQAFEVSLGASVQVNAAGRLQGEGGAPVSVWVDPTIPYDVTVTDAAGATVWEVTGYRQPDPDLAALQVVTQIDTPFVLAHTVALQKLAHPTAAMTALLFDPSDEEEGTVIHIQAETAFAHIVSVVSGIAGAGGGADTCTFGGAIGDGLTLIAVDGTWHLVSSRNVVIS